MQKQQKIILLSLVISTLLMLAKFVAYFITSSNAILTDAAESIVNVLASAFAFYSIYLAAQPRDLNHPYGHGKVEFFSVFVEGALIVMAGVLITFKSVYNLIYPQTIHLLVDGSLIIGVTGIVNYVVGYYLVKQSRIFNSMTLYADGKHLMTDAYTSAGLVMGLLLIYFTGLNYLDSLFSGVLGLFIIYSGYKLLRKSIAGLMDESDFGLVEEVVGVLNENRKNSWIDIHNLRTQRYGAELHIDCHITLPYYFDLTQVHEEVSEIDKLINEKSTVPTEFFIHADPCLPECCHYCRMTDCPVRSEPKRIDYTWNTQNVIRNQKHFF
ncbi:MAG TPA: cation diffusion facilitator family transporter [Daejeonella sp.]|nr:cation diffusion facilitator family transporter [Daejeonella sp.]